MLEAPSPAASLHNLPQCLCRTCRTCRTLPNVFPTNISPRGRACVRARMHGGTRKVRQRSAGFRNSFDIQFLRCRTFVLFNVRQTFGKGPNVRHSNYVDPVNFPFAIFRPMEHNRAPAGQRKLFLHEASSKHSHPSGLGPWRIFTELGFEQSLP
jgi:hypothetical protein